MQSLGNCLLCSLFASCYPALCYCSISSSCHIDSAYSVSGSCNTSVAILTQLEAVLQLICSSILYLQQGRGSTLVSLFLLKLLWRHNIRFLSRSSFNISSLSLTKKEEMKTQNCFFCEKNSNETPSNLACD